MGSRTNAYHTADWLRIADLVSGCQNLPVGTARRISLHGTGQKPGPLGATGRRALRDT
ncbi:hypothetical protein FAIPA1_230055 [Frankia sp. AiPs1]